MGGCFEVTPSLLQNIFFNVYRERFFFSSSCCSGKEPGEQMSPTLVDNHRILPSCLGAVTCSDSKLVIRSVAAAEVYMWAGLS